MVMVVDELTLNSSIPTAPQDSISTETLTLGRIQTHKVCTVFIKIPLMTGERNQMKKIQFTNLLGGAHI